MKKILLSMTFALVSAFTFAQSMYVCKDGNYTEVSITDGLEISLTEGIDSITFYEPQFDNPSITKDYTVEIAATENGAVTADVSEAQAGETVTLTVTPAEGYDIVTLTVTYGEYGTGVKVVATEDEGVYTFTMPENDVTVSATFAGISGEPIYYWYLGPETPLTMTSISPIVTNDRDGWRLIGDKLNTPYSSSNMFFKGIINFDLTQHLYMALPTEANVYSRSMFDHTSILASWVKQTTKDIEGVNYTIYKWSDIWAMSIDNEIF